MKRVLSFFFGEHPQVETSMIPADAMQVIKFKEDNELLLYRDSFTKPLKHNIESRTYNRSTYTAKSRDGELVYIFSDVDSHVSPIAAMFFLRQYVARYTVTELMKLYL